MPTASDHQGRIMPGSRTVPDFIRDLIERCNSDAFLIARTKSFPTSELASGKLAHLGITFTGGQVIYARAVVPDAENGRWSKYNVDGRIRIRRDLPKVTKTFGG